MLASPPIQCERGCALCCELLDAGAGGERERSVTGDEDAGGAAEKGVKWNEKKPIERAVFNLVEKLYLRHVAIQRLWFGCNLAKCCCNWAAIDGFVLIVVVVICADEVTKGEQKLNLKKNKWGNTAKVKERPELERIVSEKFADVVNSKGWKKC